MAIFTAAALITAGLGAASLALQYKGMEATAEAREKQNKLREIQERRKKRRSFREARLARARVLAEAGAAGVPSTSSSVQGATSSIQSQLGSNLSFLDRTSALQGQIAEDQEQASIFQAYSGIASSAFQLSGGFETIFSDTATTSRSGKTLSTQRQQFLQGPLA